MLEFDTEQHPTPAELESVAMRMAFEHYRFQTRNNNPIVTIDNMLLHWEHYLENNERQFWLSYALKWHYGIEPKEDGK